MRKRAGSPAVAAARPRPLAKAPREKETPEAPSSEAGEAGAGAEAGAELAALALSFAPGKTRAPSAHTSPGAT